MTWTDPEYYPVQHLEEAADWDVQVKANLEFLYEPPRVLLTHSTTQTVANGGDEGLNFNTETDDPLGMHASSAEFVDISVDGSYRVGVTNVEFDSGGVAGSRRVRVAHHPEDDTSTEIRTENIIAIQFSSSCFIGAAGTLSMLSGQSCRAKVGQVSGGTRTISSGPLFRVIWIGAYALA